MHEPRFKSSTSGQPADRLSLDEAEAVALGAVAFLAADEDALIRLLRLTGLDLEGLKTHLKDRATLAGILAVLMEDEARLMAFCDARALAPTVPAAAWRLLAPPPSDVQP